MLLKNNLVGKYVRISMDNEVLNVHYLSTGDDASGYPPIILLHGSGPGACGGHSFSKNIDYLVDQGFRLIVLDWPGWGDSDSIVSRGSRAQLNSRILQLVLEALNIVEPVSLIGSSMGAHSSAMFAIEFPAKVAKLVLVSGGSGSRALLQPSLTDGQQKIIAFYREPTIERMRDLLRVVIFNHSTITEETVQARYALIMKRLDHIDNYCQSLEINRVQYLDESARLREIVSPTLIVWGREDRVLPLDLGVVVSI